MTNRIFLLNEQTVDTLDDLRYRVEELFPIDAEGDSVDVLEITVKTGSGRRFVFKVWWNEEKDKWEYEAWEE